MIEIDGGANSSISTVTVKKEPEDAPSTSQQAQQHEQSHQPTIAVSMAPTHHVQQHALVDPDNGNDNNQTQHIVAQQDNTDGTTSLSIAHVQPITSTHQLTLSNINQV